jgi:hypothetical protein
MLIFFLPLAIDFTSVCESAKQLLYAWVILFAPMETMKYSMMLKVKTAIILVVTSFLLVVSSNYFAM